jgi:hypothetical protein
LNEITKSTPPSVLQILPSLPLFAWQLSVDVFTLFFHFVSKMSDAKNSLPNTSSGAKKSAWRAKIAHSQLIDENY